MNLNLLSWSRSGSRGFDGCDEEDLVGKIALHREGKESGIVG